MSRTAVVVLALLVAASAPRAHAAGKKASSTQTSRKSTESKPAQKQPAEPAPTETKPAETRPADAPVQQSEESDMDFDLLEPSPAAESPRLVDPALEKAIATRRTMLTVHQGLGLATLTTLAATIVVGQLHFNDRYRGGGDTGRFDAWHTGLVIGSSSLFAGTGLLGLFAPTPFKKELRLDTITLHKIFVSLATAGMLTQVVLGLVTGSQEGKLSQVDLATAHQVVGYATLGAVGAGALMIVF
ncbi:hypothetical protein ATI61_12252 [Archangium gephyra]|uniref:Cytochrome b561 domain-containing protein n=1 Tax=Archangium gephyra TaxID=48 RepID=A0AAC8Q073_9BACT|nr:hypothetical protein [Archangium gephyra]AKI98550.1 Hypothetical protein AA314_00177 [Archangium gephyra]REG20352.1 hypothetical protein ATI61_12252 [Archangium gephyra]